MMTNVNSFFFFSLPKREKKHGGIQSPYRRHINHRIELLHTWRPIVWNSEYSSSSYQLCDSTKSRECHSRGVKFCSFSFLSISNFYLMS